MTETLPFILIPQPFKSEEFSASYFFAAIGTGKLHAAPPKRGEAGLPENEVLVRDGDGRYYRYETSAEYRENLTVTALSTDEIPRFVED